MYAEGSNQYTIFTYIDESQQGNRNDDQYDEAESVEGLRKWTSTKGIGKWEGDLTRFNFCRVHKQTIVNLRHVTAFDSQNDIVKVVDNEFSVSTTGRVKLLNSIRAL